MHGSSTRRRGEPLIVLVAITLGWVAVRAMAWHSPFPPAQDVASPPGSAGLPAVNRQPALVVEQAGRVPIVMAPVRLVRGGPRRTAGRYGVHFESVVTHELIEPLQFRPAATDSVARDSASFPVPADRPMRARSGVKPWHVDTWFAWRAGSAGRPAGAVGQPLTLAYGASQAGAVARFDLSSSPRRPQAYVRVVHAPDRPGQSDLAAGLSARPLGAVPIRLQLEARATRSQTATFVRPAAVAVTELPPFELPLGLSAEAYAQAGWAGGRYATGFFDGHARIDRKLTAIGPAKVRVGAGVWGGAQKAAGRIDVGPTVTLDLRESAIPARLSVDYRYQALGNARPGSGMAVTLSTGF